MAEEANSRVSSINPSDWCAVMCRLAAFPPGFDQATAIKIVANFAKGNVDGTGTVHVKDGKFVVVKTQLPFRKALNKFPLFDHMPYDGWTLAHLRAASHGKVAYRNTHPFVKGDWAIVHNGIWSDYKLVKAAMGSKARWEGETDSEVAARLFAMTGPKKFYNLVSFGGVFLGLNRSGELWAVKTSGDLELAETTKGPMLASGFDAKWDGWFQNTGWLQFSADGKIVGREQDEFIKPQFGFKSHFIEHETTPRFKQDVSYLPVKYRDIEPPIEGEPGRPW